VAANWIGGGIITDGGAPMQNVALAAGTLILIVLIERFAPPVLARISILLGIVIGTLAALPMGLVHWGKVGSADWVGITTPFYFGFPIFEVAAIVSMCIVALVIMTETTGDILAIGEIVDVKIDSRRLADGLRADGLSTTLGGVFNTFPYTAFAQNVGLVSITGVRSRYVATFAGGVLILLGLTPKMGASVEGIPQPVLGGAGIALFGMVAASGVRTLSTVKFNNGRGHRPGRRDDPGGAGLVLQRLPELVQDDLPLRHLGRCHRRDPAQSVVEFGQGTGAGRRAGDRCARRCRIRRGA
jgi:NCS2 family nucleobase:cation symporter-2